MKKLCSLWLFLGLLSWSLIFATTCPAVEVWGVDVLQHGTYMTQVGQVEEAEDSPAERQRLVTGTEFFEETFNIPAVLGTRFGFTYVINGIPKGDIVPIRIRKLFPGLKDPRRDQVLYSHEDVREHEIGKVYGIGYGFDHDWELVPGKWTFEIFYEGNMLAEISFDVYQP